ncbi:MAG: MATE family efflux transporter [Clostridium sp.]
MNRLNELEKMSTLKSILIFSLPSIVALVLESITAIVDTAFAGNIGGSSTYALSAMGALSPIMTMLIAIQLLFGLSTGILVSRSIGEGDKEKSVKIFKIGYFLTIITSIVVSLLIFIFMDHILTLLGATGEVFILAKEYLFIALFSNVFSSVGYMLVNIIRSIGYPKMEMIICIVATLLNIILNTLFTIVFKMGMTGIALATLSSEILYLLWSIIYLKKMKFYFSPLKPSIKENKQISITLFKIGFVQFFLQAMLSLTSSLTNISLISYGSISDLAVRAVLFSTLTMLIMPLAGLSQGIQNILSFFVGRGNTKKVYDVLKCSIIISFIYGIVAYLLIGIKPSLIISIFTSSSQVIALSSSIMTLFLITFPLSGVFYILITYMQVAEKEADAMKLTVLKQVLLYLPLILILPIIFNKFPLGLTPSQSVFLATPIADSIIILISLMYLYKASKSL